MALFQQSPDNITTTLNQDANKANISTKANQAKADIPCSPLVLLLSWVPGFSYQTPIQENPNFSRVYQEASPSQEDTSPSTTDVPLPAARHLQ